MLGQTRSKSQLLQAIESGRIPHALLFLGQPGGEGLALANWFARQILCENQAAADENCTCRACQKTAKWIHPDLHFSYPTVGPKAVSAMFAQEWRAALAENPWFSTQNWLDRIKNKESANAQGNITAEECSAILKKLSLKIFEGSHKILLLWRPEFLGEQGNKLLKLIEEPPEQTIFLLVAENADLILPTILSRTQLVKVDLLTDDEVKNGLLSRKNLPPERAERIAFLADGNFGQALEMADADDSDDAKFLLEWLRECYKYDGPKLLKRTDEFASKGRENQKQFFGYALHFMREFMVLRETGNPRIRLRPDELTTAQNLTKVIDFQRVVQISGLLNDAQFQVERNANPKILFLDASIQVNRILKN